jgi:hypothetical protein
MDEGNAGTLGIRASEAFSALGSPARLLGRAPLLPRYLLTGASLAPRPYVAERYGTTYWCRPWLLFDTAELEVLENLINKGSEDQLKEFREAQLSTARNTAVVVSVSVLL